MPASVSLFSEFLSDYFIETGSHIGDGIQTAIDSGFEKIISMEIVEDYYNHCLARFSRELGDKVLLFDGDSRDILKKVIILVHEKATFWLDAHYSGGKTGGKNDRFPLLEELEIIKNHSLNNHNILIDDIRFLGTDYFYNVTLDDVKDKLLSINSKYQFEFRNGFKKDDVLVARVIGENVNVR